MIIFNMEIILNLVVNVTFNNITNKSAGNQCKSLMIGVIKLNS